MIVDSMEVFDMKERVEKTRVVRVLRPKCLCFFNLGRTLQSRAGGAEIWAAFTQ